jgi:ribonuclease VapC
MVIDTSALCAILFDEKDAESFELAIEKDPVRLISAAVFLETAMVVETRYGEAGGRELDLLIHKAAVEIVAVTADQIELARRGFRLYGKGKHRAGLNFGDCFSYALAHSTGEPLLFKGEDFSQTDVRAVPI